MRFFAAFLMLVIAGASMAGAPVRYWVFFTDRGPGLQERLELQSTLIAQGPSASRRASVGALEADEHDLQPFSEYTASVEAVAGVPVAGVSRYLNGCSVVLDSASLERVGFASVRGVGASCGKVGLRARGVPFRTRPPRLSLGQLAQAGLTGLHARGFFGQGVVLGVLDSGFELDHPCFAGAQVLDVWDFVGNDGYVGYEEGDPVSTAAHGTRVFSIIAGNQPGLYIGGAPEASFLLARTEDTGDEYPQEEDFWVFGLEWCEAGGAG